ncbi:MAG: UDP-N-acetylmuramoyl-tripeptide--D-alanyl-D-alanine ligase [Ignavibacteriales bacterium]|nr:UDP-N-acetylmuramoyl-tripeptide--D-alanyl-D-alanine ligase [Ignavibacteriales bacterium]
MMTLTDILQLDGIRVMNLSAPKVILSSVSTDSRTIAAGDLFIALRGESFDGHYFVRDVVTQGAAAVMVDEAWFFEHAAEMRTLSIPFFVVPDTTKALGDLARIYRNKFPIPVIAVGGSNGKTTTKEMIVAVLEKKYRVLGTQGNLNNHIGVPQMIFRLKRKHQMAVLELGTNHPGELKYLCSIAQPTHALITNIGNEHLEFFGNLDGVAREEMELFRALGPKGIAFVNVDDPNLAGAAKSLKASVGYGTGRTAAVRALKLFQDNRGCGSFTLKAGAKTYSVPVAIGVPGLHNLANGIAAAAVGLKFGVPFHAIAAALRECKGAAKRMQIVERNGMVILNDTYNANPDSVRAALATLKDIRSIGKKIVVLADMLELGSRAVDEHIAIGRDVAKSGFEYLLTVGPLAENIARGSQLAAAKHYATKQDLLVSLRQIAQSGDVVLVKGSRGMKMEEIADQL